MVYLDARIKAPSSALGMLRRMAPHTTPAILVLGRDTCEDTTRSRALLDRLAVPFTYLKVDEDPAADAWVRRLNGGQWLTPTILLGDPKQPDTILREPSDEELASALGLA